MPLKSNIRNPIEIRKSVDVVLNKAKYAYPSLGLLSLESEENILIDTMPNEFGTISMRYKINDKNLKSSIRESINNIKSKYPEFPPSNIDIDTLWYSCSAYFDYDGKNTEPICSMRNGFQYPLDNFISKELYDNLQNGMAFVIENSLLIAAKNKTIKDIDKQLYKLMEM